MKANLLPQLSDSFLESPMSDESTVEVQRWQANLRQSSRQWLRAGGDITQWLDSFSQLRRDMVRKAWKMTVPADWRKGTDYIMLGSAARGEDVLTSDLDHGLFFADTSFVSSENWKSLCPYLYQFIQVMSRLGFPPCQGFVMSTNPRWVGTSSQWHERIETYLQLPNWENVRYLFMMVDSVVLPDEEESALYNERQGKWNQIRTRVVEEISASPYLCWEMAHLGIHTTVASLSHLGGMLSIRQRSVNVKTGLINPVIHSLRLLSIAEGVLEISTFDRLRELEELQVIDRGLARDLRACLQYGWKHRILNSIDEVAVTEEDADILSHKLTGQERELLSGHLRTAKTLERMVHRRFRKPR